MLILVTGVSGQGLWKVDSERESRWAREALKADIEDGNKLRVSGQKDEGLRSGGQVLRRVFPRSIVF